MVRKVMMGSRGVALCLLILTVGGCSPKANEPFCTRSQTITYRDRDGRRIAIVHQYLRQDGTLGASGAPDPKKLWQDGVVYEARD